MAEAAPAQDPASTDPDEARRLQQCAAKWIAELTSSEKAQRQWLERAKKIVRRYKKDDSQLVKDRRFSMLWSNTQTVHPAVYSRPPQPVVARRFQDADPVGRLASEVLERALTYSIDTQGLDGVLRQASFDYVLIARGQSWERYEPTFGPEITPEVPLQVKTGGDESTDPVFVDDGGIEYAKDEVEERDGEYFAQGEPYAPVEFEESITDYVNWEDFGHSIARTWDEVSYVWRRVYLSRKQLIERFGEALGKLVPLDWGPVEQGNRDEGAKLLKKAAIYEIWDKAERKVYWISKSWSSRPLDERDDPLGLDGFFPCPKPLLGTTANDTVLPIPDYVYYQDQAEEIDALTQRIAALERGLKVRGFYAGDIKTNLNNLLNSDNNIMIPVPDWQTLKDGGGLAGKIEWFPIVQVVQTLKACIELRAQMIEDVYAITGIADIMRGMNDPRATAAAEKIKTAWGTLRVRERQVEVMRFARDILRIKAEVIAEKFDPETLKLMTGVKIPTAAEKAQAQALYDQGLAQYQQAVQQAQLTGQEPPPPPPVPPEIEEALSSPTWEDVLALLRDNAKRQFRIDIETDSTIEPNESEQKAQAVELVGALSQMVSSWGPAIAQAPQLAPMAAELTKWAVRRFRAGRELEDVIDRTMDEIAKAPPAQPEQQQPPPDQSKVQAAVIDQQTAQMQEQGETQREQMRVQLGYAELEEERRANAAKVIALPRDREPQVSI